MKITIDTKEDSATDIRKVIALLSKLIEDSSEHHSNIFEDSNPGLEPNNSEPNSGNAFANMFGDNPIIAEEKKEDNGEEKKDMPEIVEY
ncbi:hypothetical protein KY342_06810 [Candidatus Woesearchaeota archaeon]|nr:hypothetical protein [Candidatus Woesearchaeota archaeon]